MRMIKIPAICGLLTAMLLLSACSHLGATENPKFMRYATTLPPLTVPAGIPNPEGESYYPVPVVASSAPPGTVPPLTPPGSQLERLVNKPKLPLPA
jgi:uncharacterized lipoprotein